MTADRCTAGSGEGRACSREGLANSSARVLPLRTPTHPPQKRGSFRASRGTGEPSGRPPFPPWERRTTLSTSGPKAASITRCSRRYLRRLPHCPFNRPPLRLADLVFSAAGSIDGKADPGRARLWSKRRLLAAGLLIEGQSRNGTSRGRLSTHRIAHGPPTLDAYTRASGGRLDGGSDRAHEKRGPAARALSEGGTRTGGTRCGRSNYHPGVSPPLLLAERPRKGDRRIDWPRDGPAWGSRPKKQKTPRQRQRIGRT